ncbi:MAG TPA: acetylxylan esterase [Solirubrobacterales bacterium]
MRVVRKLWVLMGALATLAFAPSAHAEIPSVFNGEAAGGAGIACVAQEGVRFCEGSAPGNSLPPAPDTRVPGVGGVPIDVNVALPPEPPSGTDGNYPLLMMFHGYGGHKFDLGEMKRFAERGYAVFSMSDRGFGDSCGSVGSRLTPGCAEGWVRLLDTRYEVRDAQIMAGILADEGVVDPQRIGATGGSYGGGMSMALAALRDRVMNEDGSLAPWTSPGGTPMRIAAAAPEIPWTDLAYALSPNGGTLDFVADSPYDTDHAGISKQSYIAGLFASGQASGFYAPPGADGDADLVTWFARINAGEPYEGDPLITDIVDELTTHHSSYYIDHSQPPAPLLISNGWTDDLFPVDEAIRFYNRTNSEHPSADISLYFLDYGHMRGANKQADVAKLTAAQDAFLDHYLLGLGAEPAESVTAITQTCPGDSPSAGPFAAPTWDELSPGELRFVGEDEQTIAPVAGDPETNQAFDPVGGGGACATASGDDQQGAATYRLGAAMGGGFTLAGSPTVIADIDSPGPTSQVAARLVDVAPSGDESLVARALYRPGTGELSAGGTRQVFQLHANGWKFENGHVAKLELLPNDTPYGRVSNGQAPVTVSNLDLRLPTRERAGSVAAPGGVGGSSTGTIDGPLPAVIPEGSAPAPGVTAAGPCQSGLTEKGTKRNDRLKGTAGGDRLRGGAGNDKLSGKDGDDCLNGGKGKDRVSAGDGDDTVKARDGKRDRVNCGKGNGDVVSADRRDRVRGCERKRR